MTDTEVAFSCTTGYFLSHSPHIALLQLPLVFNNRLSCHFTTVLYSIPHTSQLTSSNHQPVPAKTGTAAHSGGEEGLVEGWLVGISILLAGAVFAGKQSGI